MLRTIDYHTTTKNQLRSQCLEAGLVAIKNHPVNSKENLKKFSEQLGPLLHWDFGAVNELIVDAEKENYLYSSEEVPFHWDGAFKTVPRYLVFHCIEPGSSGGETLFCDTERLLSSLDERMQQRLSSLSVNYKTEKKVHYGGEFTHKLVASHPDTGRNILRYAESVDTRLNPVEVSILGLEHSEELALKAQLKRLLYGKNSYTHCWQKNDLIIADNYRLLHARKKLGLSSSRHLRRCQIKE